MPDFAYIARDSTGSKVTGTIVAASEREAASLLSSQLLFPVNLAVEKSSAGLHKSRRISGQLIATVYGQMAALIRSGVPLLRSIAVLRDQTSRVALKDVLQDVYDQIEQGATLADAMARHRKAFDETAVSMVRAGGEGGFLEEALDRVAKFTEEREDLKARTMGALAYPVFLGVVGTIVVACLLIFFVPSFEEMFSKLRERGELPIVTDWLLWFSASLTTWQMGVAVLGAILVGVFARNQLDTEGGRRWKDKWKLTLPMIGRILKNLAVARFCRVLGTLLRNGVPILKSLDISRAATANYVLSEAIAEAAGNISAGESLAAPLAESGHFPPNVVEMIAVAEESNTLETVLTDIADGLEKRTSRELDLFVRLLEPLLLLILAGIVLVVVIALLLPVLKMSSTI